MRKVGSDKIIKSEVPISYTKIKNMNIDFIEFK